MKRLLIMIGLTSVILAGCQSQDEIPVVPTPVPVPEEPVRDYVLADLTLSLPASSAASTRLSETVVQQSDNFRGVSQLTLVPFFTQGKVTVTDLPTYCETGSLMRDFETLAANERYRYYEKFHLKHGVASFLTYGRSDPGTAKKAERGSLLATVDGTTAEGIPVDAVVSPGNLSFALDPIYNSVAAEASVKARAIADYLTYIAETPGWEGHANPTLKTLYQNFISEVNGEYGVIAGSSVNVVAYVNDLYQKMEAQTSSTDYSTLAFKNVVDGVMTRITDYTSDSDELTLAKSGATITGLGDCNDYPDCYGLPDGAAVLQWGWDDSLKKYVFLPRTETTTSAPISGAKRYAYPPELYYYGNSTIQTSNEEVLPQTDYTDSWANVLSTRYKDGTVVSSNTLAVAIKDHMQYAVAHLKATVKADATLKDAADQPIIVGSKSFPVTGLIVSGQHPVGFDFRPETVDNGDDHECFVYDNQLSTSPLYLTDTESVPIHTLLLQTKENEAVTMILEVKNDSGQDFMGKNGVVFNGTKFYLVGKVKPAKGDASDSDVTEQDDLKKRVFTQDHTTEMTMKVKTLKEAFNVMPNIQTGRLEVSVEVVLKWNQTDPFSFQFEE